MQLLEAFVSVMESSVKFERQGEHFITYKTSLKFHGSNVILYGVYIENSKVGDDFDQDLIGGILKRGLIALSAVVGKYQKRFEDEVFSLSQEWECGYDDISDMRKHMRILNNVGCHIYLDENKKLKSMDWQFGWGGYNKDGSEFFGGHFYSYEVKLGPNYKSVGAPYWCLAG